MFSLQVVPGTHYLPIICPGSSPSNQEGLSHPCRTPSLRYVSWDTTCQLLRVRVCPCRSSLILRSFSRAGVLTLHVFFCPTLLRGSLSYSFVCIGVLLTISSQYSVGTAARIDVFFRCLWRQVSSMSSCFTILIPPRCITIFK